MNRRMKSVSKNVSLRLGTTLVFLPFLFWAPFKYAFSHEPVALGNSREAQRREVRIPIRDFRLIDQNGRPFGFSSVRGKVVVLAFAYTTCLDVCPLTTAAMRQVQTELNQTDAGSVYFLTITTDPEVDNAGVLAAYAKRYGVDFSNWVFLTGQEAVLKGVWQNFGVTVARKARGLIDHTSLTAVIDRTGRMRFAYSGASPDPRIVIRDARSLLGRR
jgi:protein SCO1